MLSANTEDLRTLAKQFGNNNTVSNIYGIIKDVIGHNNNKKLNKEPLFRGEPPVADNNRSKHDIMHYEVNLNDLVKQVKQKLQKDLLRMSADDELKTIEDTNERLNKLLSSSDIFDVLEDDEVTGDQNDNDSAQNKAIDDEFHNNEADNPNLNQNDVVQPSIYKLDEDKPELKLNDDYLTAIPKVETKNHPNKHIYIKPKIKMSNHERVRITVKKPVMLTGFNMEQENNSSKDYVNSKENEDYSETEIDSPKIAQQNPYVQIKQSSNQQKPKDYENYEDETTNYNKKKSKIKINNEESKFRNDDNDFKQGLSIEKVQKESLRTQLDSTEEQMQPYAEQIKELEFDKIEDRRDTIEAKNDDTSSNVYATIQDVKINEGNEMKISIEQHKKTILSKIDSFEMRAPKDSLNLPMKAEKYKFNTVIPEEDWVRDNFENM